MATYNLTKEQNERVTRLVTDLLTRHTQVQIPAAVGVDQSTISSIKTGKTGTSRTIALRLAKFAGVDPETLLGPEPVEVWRLNADAVTGAVAAARAIALSEGFDSEWVSAWTPDVERPQDLTAAQAWKLLEADWILKQNPRVQSHELRRLVAKINEALTEAIHDLDAEPKQKNKKPGT